MNHLDLNVAFKMSDFALSSEYEIPFAALIGETPTVSCLILLINCMRFHCQSVKQGIDTRIFYGGDRPCQLIYMGNKMPWWEFPYEKAC